MYSTYSHKLRLTIVGINKISSMNKSSLLFTPLLKNTTSTTTTTNPTQKRFFASDVVVSPPKEKAPLKTRFAWFTTGLAITLGLGLYQVGSDASQAAQTLELELKTLRDETVKTQQVLRARIAKLEAQLASTTPFTSSSSSSVVQE
jgi:hypothetical protein